MSSVRGAVRLSVLVVVAGVFAAVPGAQGVGETCRGLPVTMQNEPGEDLEGTPGPDVMLVSYGQGAWATVDGGGGNDVICVVAGPPSQGFENRFVVSGGDGDDIVDATALPVGHPELNVGMSVGADTFYGGPEQDDVSALDDDVDVIDTGAGGDAVFSGTYGKPNPDQVDLGEGDDFFAFIGTGGATLATGGGADRLHISHYPTLEPPPGGALPPGALVVDAAAGTSTFAGKPYLSWTGSFAGFDFALVQKNPLTFHGSDDPEEIELSRARVEVDMGGGDDRITHLYWAFPRGAVDGGTGRDWIAIGGSESISVDLMDEAVVETKGGNLRHLGLAGIEIADVGGGATSIELRGTPGADQLNVYTRVSSTVVGRGGNDYITLGRFAAVGDGKRIARGGAGDDLVVGSGSADLLIGGRGSDTALGKRGRDTCRAEIVRGCELS